MEKENLTQQMEILIMINQDRHLGFKLQLPRSGDFRISWLPDFAVGINDFDVELFYGDSAVNNFLSRVYAVASKRFPTAVGDIGAHAGYQFNNPIANRLVIIFK